MLVGFYSCYIFKYDLIVCVYIYIYIYIYIHMHMHMHAHESMFSIAYGVLYI